MLEDSGIDALLSALSEAAEEKPLPTEGVEDESMLYMSALSGSSFGDLEEEEYASKPGPLAGNGNRMESKMFQSQESTDNLSSQSDAYLQEKLNLIMKEIERRKREDTTNLNSSGSTTPDASLANCSKAADFSIARSSVSRDVTTFVDRGISSSEPSALRSRENLAPNAESRSANRRIAHQQSTPLNLDGEKAIKDAITRATASQKAQSRDLGSDLIYDSFFGIKIQQPKVSRYNFDWLVVDRPKKTIGAVLKMRDISSSDWYTMGVIVSKTGLKISARGNQYVIWRLCDLRSRHEIISAFLYGNCLNKHLALPLGTVVAILNVAHTKGRNVVLSNKANTLQLDVAENVLEMGPCPDFAICKSRQIKTGEPCSNFVNKSESDVCDFHLSSTLKRYASKRGELQFASSLPTGGRMLSAAHSQPPRSASRPIVGGGLKISSSKVTVDDIKSMLNNTRKGGGAKNGGGKDQPTLLSALQKPTVGSKSLIKALGLEEPDSFKSSSTMGEHFLVSNSVLKNQQYLKRGGARASLPAVPKLGKGSKNGIILLDDVASKRRATEIQKRAIGSTAVRKREMEENQCKRGRLGDFVISKEEMANLAGRSTEAEKDLRDDAAKQEEYFKVMEAKEKLETRASQLFEIPNCAVITCKKCDYTWHSRSEFCKQQGHVVSKTTATKRFFQCKVCGKRTIAYSMYPRKPCAGCKVIEFQRVAMKEERKGPKMGAEALKVRGDELPFVGS
uniref:Protein MCM10 homolog n=1 Tax=Trichuris muris TaxID=70415 RepID=A0A5S6QH58_TRIMR